MNKPWFLYIIQCEGGSLYTGITVNVDARFAQHASGKGAKYTRTHRPIKIVHVEAFDDRSAASKREYAVKQLTATAKLALCGIRKR